VKKETKEGVVGFAFGKPRSIPANNYISMIVCRKSRELDAPVFTQFDVLILDPTIKVSYATEYVHKTPTTYEVAYQAIDWALKNEIKKLWVVMAPCHLARCFRDIDYVAEQKKAEIEFEICQEIYSKEYRKDWFCKRSQQWWTRSWWQWWPRELLLLLTPIFFYKKRSTKVG
jgi:hypothetical protein